MRRMVGMGRRGWNGEEGLEWGGGVGMGRRVQMGRSGRRGWNGEEGLEWGGAEAHNSFLHQRWLASFSGCCTRWPEEGPPSAS